MAIRQPLYRVIANTFKARINCEASNNRVWFEQHTERLAALVKEHMPSGSGFDAGTTIDMDATTSSKLVFLTSFHHMDENGSYDGWTEHRVTVLPSLTQEYDLRISGRDRNSIKDYIADVFAVSLSTEV